MENLLCNPGLYYVTEQILQNLSNQELARCRLISKKFKNFIDSNKALDERKRSIIFKKILIKVARHVTENHEKFKNLLYSPHFFFKSLGDKFWDELTSTQTVFIELFDTVFETSDLHQIWVFMKKTSFDILHGNSCPFVKLNLFQLAFLLNNIEIVAVFLKYLNFNDVKKYLQTPLKELNLNTIYYEKGSENLHDLALHRGQSELLDLIWNHDPRKRKISFEELAVSDDDYLMSRLSTRFSGFSLHFN